MFVNTMQNGKTSVVVAKEGALETDSHGDKFLVMQKGRRYDGVPNQPDFQMMEFDRYGVLVSQQSKELIGDKSARSMSMKTLLTGKNVYNLSELLWRIALPLMALALMLLAIPLGFVNPRAGRSANLIIALLLFVTYINMVSIFQAWVKQGRYSFASAWWPIHLIGLLIVAGFFLWRLKVNSRYHPLVLWSALKRSAITRHGKSGGTA